MRYRLLHGFWHDWLLEPSQWIFQCFFQPERFRYTCQQWQVQGPLHRQCLATLRPRLIRVLHVLLPAYLCASAVALLWTLLLFLLSIVLNPTKKPANISEMTSYILEVETHLVITIAFFVIITGVGLGLARGITIGIVWGFLLPLNVLFTPTEVILEFAFFGALIFGTAFYCADIRDDMLSSIVWIGGVILFWLLEVALGWLSWNPIELLSSLKMLLLLSAMSGLIWLLCSSELSNREKNTSKTAPSFSSTKSYAMLVWIAIWFLLPMRISYIYVFWLLLAGHSSAAANYIFTGSLYGAVGILFFSLPYMLGALRIILYPFDVCSLLFTYIRAKKYPQHALSYLQHSAAYWDECIVTTQVPSRKGLDKAGRLKA